MFIEILIICKLLEDGSMNKHDRMARHLPCVVLSPRVSRLCRRTTHIHSLMLGGAGGAGGGGGGGGGGVSPAFLVTSISAE